MREWPRKNYDGLAKELACSVWLETAIAAACSVWLETAVAATVINLLGTG